VSRSFPRLRSRLIADADIEGVATLLAKGFKRRTREYWLRALDRLARHPTPAGFPKYGYLMEIDGAPIGVILLIFSTIQNGDSCAIRCNVSSWYVEATYRALATLLSPQAVKKKDITYVNISPASHVQRIVEAQGFSRYSNGQFVAFPALFPAISDSHGTVLEADARPDVTFESFEWDILLTHAEYGCTSFWIRTVDRAYPFVFLPRIVRGCIPCAQLIYCRAIEDFVRFSRPIGSYLLSHRRPLVLIDSNGPIPGLLGKYIDGVAPKYFRGPEPPRLGDLAYSEAAMFGL
jgi:hypothetical protein